MFFVGASLYIFGFIVFVLCGSGELQPWAKVKYARVRETVETPIEPVKKEEHTKIEHRPSRKKKKNIPDALDLKQQLLLLSQIQSDPNKSGMMPLQVSPEGKFVNIFVEPNPRNKPSGRSQSVKVPKKGHRSLENFPESSKNAHHRSNSVKSDTTPFTSRKKSKRNPGASSHGLSYMSLPSNTSISDNEDPQCDLRQSSSGNTTFFDTLEESTL